MDAAKTVTAHFTVSVDVTIAKSGNYPKLDWTHQATVRGPLCGLPQPDRAVLHAERGLLAG